MKELTFVFGSYVQLDDENDDATVEVSLYSLADGTDLCYFCLEGADNDGDAIDISKEDALTLAHAIIERWE